MRRIIELITSILGWSRYRLKVRIRPTTSSVKINLGCGLTVYPGWINIDGSLNAFMANMPRIILYFAYLASGSNRYYAYNDYLNLLKNNTFFHADLSCGIPSGNESVDYIYSSHFLEHLYPSEAKSLMLECFRVLKPGGAMRICVPDLEYAVSLYRAGSKREALDKYFFVEDKGSEYARHKYMYDFE